MQQKSYIKFVKNYFKDNPKTFFEQQNIFQISNKYFNKFDIVFCSKCIITFTIY